MGKKLIKNAKVRLCKSKLCDLVLIVILINTNWRKKPKCVCGRGFARNPIESLIITGWVWLNYITASRKGMKSKWKEVNPWPLQIFQTFEPWLATPLNIHTTSSNATIMPTICALNAAKQQITMLKISPWRGPRVVFCRTPIIWSYATEAKDQEAFTNLSYLACTVLGYSATGSLFVGHAALIKKHLCVASHLHANNVAWQVSITHSLCKLTEICGCAVCRRWIIHMTVDIYHTDQCLLGYCVETSMSLKYYALS